MGHKRNKKDQNSNVKRQQTEAEKSEPVEGKKPKKGKKVKSDKEEASKDSEGVNQPTMVKERKGRGKKIKHQVKQKEEEEDEQENNQELEDFQENVSEDIEQEHEENIKTKKNNNVDEAIIFPAEDLAELFQRMQTAIPENDTSVYSTRVEKLNWDDISFKNYTAEDCKCQWLSVQKKVRKYRLLSEVIQSAKEWIHKPWTKFGANQKNKRHPDMPRRPLSSFMLFSLKKRDKIRAENPGLEVTEISKIITQMYKALPPAKREKYVKEAAEKRKLYEAELSEFHRQHPEVSDKQNAITKEPKKPNTPFNLFYECQLKTLDKTASSNIHKEFKEQCKEKWKNMSDKKKVVWINWSLDEENKYYDELKNYALQNPNFIPPPKKSVLTKEEKMLKERIAGKPIKPPNSAYSLYSRMMLQSDEIKNINPKYRMVYIADKWKNCSEQEKKDYSDRIVHLREQYKLDFASYLESLPEEKRQEEIRSTMPKRKRNSSKTFEEAAINERKRKKIEESVETVPETNKVNKKGKEDKSIDNDDKKKKKLEKDAPFAKPHYWNRMKKEEKRTFRNAMMKLKEHLASRFEHYVNNRESSGEEDEEDEETDNEAKDSASSSSSCSSAVAGEDSS